MRPSRTLVTLSFALLLTLGCSSDDDGPDDAVGGDGGPPPADDLPSYPVDGALEATIRRTAGGVPHVRANDLASVAFGAGHAQAEDNVCLIAEAVLKARGERARFHGPGDDNGNVISDFSYRALGVADGADEAVAALPAPSRALLEGFVAGYNRYVADTDPADLPPACREQPWVRAITPGDLFAHYRIVAQYASGDLFATGALLAGVPPGQSPDPVVVTGTAERPNGSVGTSGTSGESVGATGALDQRDAESATRVAGGAPTEGTVADVLDPRRIGRDIVRSASAPRALVDTGLASNAWGIGRALTEGGRGALLANPHFPYTGSRRFYQMHLTVPGHLDLNGAGLVGVALPLIGFNRTLAWTHTVSTSRRFTLYELTLAEGDDLAYVRDGETRPIEPETLRVEVANGTATPTVLEKTVYRTEYGPMLAADLISGGALPAWGSDGTAYTYRDANAGASATRLLDTWLGLARATTLEEFRQVFRDCGSTLWTNTTYADAAGNAFYIDSSSVPDLSEETLAALATARAANPGFAELFAGGVTVLDGSGSRDDWVEGECGALVPYERKPKLSREDFVQNSNASFWSTNPAEPLVGYSPLYGEEAAPLNARTRLGLAMLQAPTETGFATSAPAGQDGRFDALELLEVIWNDRALHAERLLPELRRRCTAIGEAEVSLPDGGSRAVDTACDVLSGWDGTYGIDSVGAHVFRVFLARYFDRDDTAPTIPFDPADPVNTPAGVPETALGTAADPLLQSLAAGLEALDAAAIAYDATLGSVQSWRPSGGAPPGGTPVALADPIPWHGGSGGLDGAFNAVGVTDSPFAEDTRFPRLAPTPIPGTGGLSATPGEGWAIGRGTSWHFGLEFTDDGPEAWGLTSYSQSSDPASPWFVDQSEAYSTKTPRRLLFDEADIAAGVLPDGTRVLRGALGTR